jgi:ribosomal-protein-alanine N-acetyltransferase
MSARPEETLSHRRMVSGDLGRIAAIEAQIYSHPWTRGNFADSLAAAYECWVSEDGGEIAGYGVMMVAAGEAHLLNLSVAAQRQRRGFGTELLLFLFDVAREGGATRIFLEVRPSNAGARALYEKIGFARIGMRRGYYPAAQGQEDAIVMERAL